MYAKCHGFDRGRVSFLYRGLYDAIFFIKNRDNIQTSLVTEQCLHRVRVVSASRSALPARTWGSPGAGMVIAATADPDWIKGYPIPYSIMLSSKLQERRKGDGVQRDGVCLPKKPVCVMSL